MKIKLDENLGDRGRAILEAAGHDACTVARQSLNGADDRQLIEACRAEGRALVTLAIDFANPLVYPPRRYPGIAVIRLPRRPTRADLERSIETLVRALAREPLDGRLWIVEPQRVRVHQEPDGN